MLVKVAEMAKDSVCYADIKVNQFMLLCLVTFREG